jgi:polyisoprenyl-teichoic acid--peptidoglycan teichoic acid transferase
MRAKKGRGKRKPWHIIVIVVAIVIFLFAAAGIYISSLFGKMDRTPLDPGDLGIDPGTVEIINENPKSKKITNIALFGIDSPKGQRGRSDSIMILTIDEGNKKIKLSSIMRDSYVNISGRGMDKINHAYSFGGPQLAVKTINENFKLNITDFATVNFSTLPQIVDAIGGVNIVIKDYEVSHMKRVGITSAGTHNLNGEQALYYSRIRYVGHGDYERTERHRAVLDAMFSKVNRNPAQLASLVTKLLPMVETSMTNMEILNLGRNAFSMGVNNIEQQRYPIDGTNRGVTIKGVWYLQFDLDANVEHMHKFIFQDINE